MRERLVAPFRSKRQCFAMTCVGVRMRLVAIGLTRLCEQDQRCCVCRLKAERQIQQDERIHVETCHAAHVQSNPYSDDQGLRQQKRWRAEEACERFRLQRKPVVAEDGRKMRMRKLKTQMIAW